MTFDLFYFLPLLGLFVFAACGAVVAYLVHGRKRSARGFEVLAVTHAKKEPQ